MGNVHVYRESREDRNKRIAIECLDLLERAANGDLRGSAPVVARELEDLRRRWERAEPPVPWVRRQVAYDLDDWVTAQEMAEYIDRAPATVRSWHYRGHVSSVPADDGTPLYNVGEVLAYEARRNTA